MTLKAFLNGKDVFALLRPASARSDWVPVLNMIDRWSIQLPDKYFFFQAPALFQTVPKMTSLIVLCYKPSGISGYKTVMETTFSPLRLGYVGGWDMAGDEYV